MPDSPGRRGAPTTTCRWRRRWRISGRIAAAVDLPVSGDFEGGFAVEPAEVEAHVALAARTGLAGLSIEDASRQSESPLLEFALAVERVAAARRAVDASGLDLVLTARSEGFIAGRPDLTETIRRLTAFADAGADCLYAPGLQSIEDITEVVRAVAPKPVNVLVGSPFSHGRDARRRSECGGSASGVRWPEPPGAASSTAAAEIAGSGTFTALGRAVPFALVNGLFRLPVDVRSAELQLRVRTPESEMGSNVGT